MLMLIFLVLRVKIKPNKLLILKKYVNIRQNFNYFKGEKLVPTPHPRLGKELYKVDHSF